MAHQDDNTSQMLIRSISSVSEIIDLKDRKVEIYYNGKLLPDDFNEEYRETLIDYAALSIIKQLYHLPITSLISIKENNSDKKIGPDFPNCGNIYCYLMSSAYSFALDLRKLQKNKEFLEPIMKIKLAIKLMSMAAITCRSFEEVGIELIENLDIFKDIIDKIEGYITP